MTQFEVRQCTDPACQMRIPIELDVHRGFFCPRCSAPMTCVVPAFKNFRHQNPSQPINHSFRVVLDNVRSAHNVGAIFRTGDGVGVEHFYLCGLTPRPSDHPEIGKTALGAEAIVPWSYHLDALDLVHNLKDSGCCLLALEYTEDAMVIYQYQVEPAADQPLILLVGNERSGLDPALMDLCEATLYLPMVGVKHSLNVSVAFGAAAYSLVIYLRN